MCEIKIENLNIKLIHINIKVPVLLSRTQHFPMASICRVCDWQQVSVIEMGAGFRGDTSDRGIVDECANCRDVPCERFFASGTLCRRPARADLRVCDLCLRWA